MNRKAFLAGLLALPLAIAASVFGKTLTQRESAKPKPSKAEGFTCPLTGETLPCPNCCPLK